MFNVKVLSNESVLQFWQLYYNTLTLGHNYKKGQLKEIDDKIPQSLDKRKFL